MSVSAEELGRRLRAAREACGMTQAEVSGELGVSRPTLTQMELGKRAVSSLELDRLAHMFGRDLREFLSEDFRDGDPLVALYRAETNLGMDGHARKELRDVVAIGRELHAIEALLEVDREMRHGAGYDLRPPSSRWDAICQGKRVAEDERRRLELGHAPLPRLTELLEAQGVRFGVVDLPEDISGISMSDGMRGVFLVVNRKHHFWRRRFSFAHEYGHVIMDGGRLTTVSRESKRAELLEVRANAFAAAFLMPEQGLRRYVEGLGKGRPSRASAEIFDGEEVVQAEGRTPPHSQELQLHDVVQIASHFGVSISAALYRLRNLKLLNKTELEALLEKDRAGGSRSIARLLGLSEPDPRDTRDEFKKRFVSLGLEAYRRELVSKGKLREIVAMVGVSDEDLDAALAVDVDD